MKSLLFGLAMAVLVTARPELYREKEDFQFSRSSSDEGTKSGYYDAQRGNMGGNYERAHNMDNLAQNQMGGLMKQVQGDLGDGSKMKSGNVFTSGNSQGIYGSGQYDLSSLGSRNFQEGTTYEGSQSQSSSANRAYESHSSSSNQNTARYSTSGLSHNSGYRGYQSGNLQEAQNLHGGTEYERGLQSGQSSGLYTQFGHQGTHEYDNVNFNQGVSNDFGVDTSNKQVRILLRPGSRVFVPINAQATTGTRTASYYNQNTENSEAEALNSGDQQLYSSSNRPKHYESSYTYRKQWEKHDTKPSVVYQVPVNSELYDSSLSHRGSQHENSNYNQASSGASQLSDAYQQQQSASSLTRNLAEFNTQQHSTATANTYQQQQSGSRLTNNLAGVNTHQQSTAAASSNSDAFSHSGYNSNANSQASNLMGSIGSQPKSYSSSYSYHKSWERQGDPYVIKPASNSHMQTQASQKLTDLSGSQNLFNSRNYGSRQSKTYSGYDCVVECDPNRHTRAARSVSNLEEQTQNEWSNLQDLGQQTQNKFDKLEDFSQQTQDAGQQTQDFGQQLQELGQQTQNKWDNLEDLSQQTQDFGQQTQDLGQQTQDLGQQTQDFGQQTQDFGQQTQDFGQQTQDLGQQTQDFGQQTQDLGQQTQDLGQQTQDLGQQTQDFGQQTQDFGQQTQDFGKQTQNFEQQNQDLGQQTQDFGQQTQDFGKQTQNFEQQNQDLGQQTQDFGQQTQDIGKQVRNFNQKPQDTDQQNVNKWDVGQETQNSWNNLQGFSQQSESLHEPKPANLNNEDKAERFQQEEIQDVGQQTQKWNQIEEQNTNEGMQPSYINKPNFLWDKITDEEQSNYKTSFEQTAEGQSVDQPSETHVMTQHTQGIWGNLDSLSQGHKQDKQPNNQKPLNSLWDKIDNLNDDYIVPVKKNDTEIYSNSFSQTSNSQGDHKYQVNFFESSFNASDTQNDQHPNYKVFESTIDKKKNNTEKSTNVNSYWEKEISTEQTTTEVLVSSTTTKNQGNKHSKDTGRGDIGPEEIIDDVITTTEIINKNTNQNIDLLYEILSTTPNSNSAIFNNHKVEIENVPEELYPHNTQQQSEDTYFQQETEDNENQNTQFSFEHNPEEQWHQSIGSKDEHASKIFGQHKATLEHPSQPDTTQTLENGWQSHHSTQHDHSVSHHSIFKHQHDKFGEAPHFDLQNENKDQQMEHTGNFDGFEQHLSHYGHIYTTSEQKFEHFNQESQQWNMDQQHSKFGQGPYWEVQHQNKDLEQRDTKTFENGWQSHHSSQHIHGPECSHENGLHHQHERHNEFNHNNGFNHQHREIGDVPDFVPQNQNKELEQKDIEALGSDFSSHYSWNSQNQNKELEQKDTEAFGNGWQSHHSFQHVDRPGCSHPSGLRNGFLNKPSGFDHQYNNLNRQYREFEEVPHFELQNENKDLDQQNEQTAFEQHDSQYTHKYTNTEQKFENFNQESQPWNSDQQNMDKFLSDSSQQNQDPHQFNNFEQRNVNGLLDFGQQTRTSDFDVIPVEISPEKTKGENIALESNRENPEVTNKKELRNEPLNQVNEEPIKKVEANVPAANINKKNTNVEIPQELTTEKPGFWKSVGTKFSSAKNKVASWFGS